MIECVAGGKALPAETKDEIVAKTDGEPLFLEELTKTVVELGLLRSEQGGYVLDRALTPLAIPSTLHDSLMARIEACFLQAVEIARGQEARMLELRASTDLARLRATSVCPTIPAGCWSRSWPRSRAARTLAMSATPALCSPRSCDRGCRFHSRPSAIPPQRSFASSNAHSAIMDLS